VSRRDEPMEFGLTCPLMSSASTFSHTYRLGGVFSLVPAMCLKKQRPRLYILNNSVTESTSIMVVCSMLGKFDVRKSKS